MMRCQTSDLSLRLTILTYLTVNQSPSQKYPVLCADPAAIDAPTVASLVLNGQIPPQLAATIPVVSSAWVL